MFKDKELLEFSHLLFSFVNGLNHANKKRMLMFIMQHRFLYGHAFVVIYDFYKFTFIMFVRLSLIIYNQVGHENIVLSFFF